MFKATIDVLTVRDLPVSIVLSSLDIERESKYLQTEGSKQHAGRFCRLKRRLIFYF